MTKDTSNRARKNRHKSDWIWEVLIFVTVIPAIVYGVQTIGSLPVA